METFADALELERARLSLSELATENTPDTLAPAAKLRAANQRESERVARVASIIRLGSQASGSVIQAGSLRRTV